GQCCQVEHAHPAELITEVPGEPGKLHALADIQRHVVETVGKTGPGLLVKIALGYMLTDMPMHQLAIAVAIVPGTGQRQNAGVRVQMAVTVQVKQGGQQLAHGQVPSTPEYHDIAGFTVSC